MEIHNTAFQVGRAAALDSMQCAAPEDWDEGDFDDATLGRAAILSLIRALKYELGLNAVEEGVRLKLEVADRDYPDFWFEPTSSLAGGRSRGQT